MGNPESNKAATQENSVSLEQQLNDVVKKMEFDEKSNTYKLPEDIPEHLKLAAIAEKRRRDTQASLTKSRQELKKLEEANKKLVSKVMNSTTLNLSEEEKQELEDLKYSDPDAWYSKMKELESKTKELAQNQLNEVMTEAEKAAELEKRQILLEQFRLEHPGINLTDEVIANDIPPRITKKLESGEISFEEFLSEAAKFIEPSVVVGDTVKTPNSPDLGSVGGGATVTKVSEEDLLKSYQNEVY